MPCKGSGSKAGAAKNKWLIFLKMKGLNPRQITKEVSAEYQQWKVCPCPCPEPVMRRL